VPYVRPLPSAVAIGSALGERRWGMVDATLGKIGDICFVLGAITDRVCESNDD